MNLLTFLGAGKYSQTTYVLGKKRHTTQYCPAAVAHFYQPETTLVVVTQKAKDMHFESLADEISAVTKPVAVPIPDGGSEAELWQIFDALTAHVAEGDELIVDITNGFRSLPFLSFLAIAFLRLARRVQVHCVLYGAWEARNESSNETPVFDLTPFVTLLDWTIAVDRFTRFGDAADLANLLREDIPPGPVLATSQEARLLRDALKFPADAMEAVSLALRMSRPLEVMTTSARLTRTLEDAGPLVRQVSPPFGLLAEQVKRVYQPLATPTDPLDRDNWQINLQIQLDLIGRYLEQGQVVQAVTLAREWLVSLLVYYFQAGSMLEYEETRKPIESALNNEAKRLRSPAESQPLLPTPYDQPMQTLFQREEIGKLWGELTQLRNDIAHAGMKSHSRDAASLRKNAERLYPRLRGLWPLKK